LRKMGLMEVINQKWSDLMGRHAFWFPTLRDHNLVYKAEETINLAIGTDSDIRGDGSLGISWIPTDDKAQTTVQNEIEYYRAISNAVPGQVIAIQHDFNVTVGIVVTAALTAISFANDWIMLCRPWQVLNTVDRIMVTNPLGKIIMPAAGKMNILAKAASVISQTISKIPVVGNVWGRLASGAKAVQGLFTGLSSKGILGDMLFRAIFPIVQPTEFIVNTARLVSWGIGLQAAGFLFSGQLKSIGEMPQEDIANLLASQAAFSGVYSYGFGITLPIIALGLKAIKLGELVKYLEMITPQRSGMATDSIANYKRFVAAFWVEEWFIEEVLYPFVLNHGLDLMQLVTGVLRDRSLSFGVMDIELELFRDFIVETVSESLGGG